MKGDGPKKIRAGLYEIAVECKGAEFSSHKPVKIMIEKIQDGEWAWEAFCPACMACDPNGYASLREAVKETPGFWKDEE